MAALRLATVPPIVTALLPLAPLVTFTPAVLSASVPVVTDRATDSVLLPASISLMEMVRVPLKFSVAPRATLAVVGPAIAGATFVKLIDVLSVLLLEVPSLAVAENVAEAPAFGAV